ncbi:MAG: putative Ribonuclease [Candidatus Saccharibacteria bacterium]|nr:putative Ribonuclease [Candidatus Saccharibacteria bacterium]
MITVGIDEVGRGCWAGPLVAGAVILYAPIIGLKDSKKLSKKQREVLAEQIHQQALAVGLGWIWPEDIDKNGISISVKNAMQMALEQIHIPYDEVIIDGNINYLVEVPFTRALIKADDLVPAASAASIVAKVARDTYMATIATGEYPGYGFERHVGYGTAEHIRSLEQYGVTPIHRQSYKPIQKFVLLSNS